MPACQKHNVGVIVHVAFAKNALTGTTTANTAFPQGSWRTNDFCGDRKREVYERVQAVARNLKIELEQLLEMCCATHKATPPSQR